LRHFRIVRYIRFRLWLQTRAHPLLVVPGLSRAIRLTLRRRRGDPPRSASFSCPCSRRRYFSRRLRNTLHGHTAATRNGMSDSPPSGFVGPYHMLCATMNMPLSTWTIILHGSPDIFPTFKLGFCSDSKLVTVCYSSLEKVYGGGRALFSQALRIDKHSS
jgi:hypothetical protein